MIYSVWKRYYVCPVMFIFCRHNSQYIYIYILWWKQQMNGILKVGWCYFYDHCCFGHIVRSTNFNHLFFMSIGCLLLSTYSFILSLTNNANSLTLTSHPPSAIHPNFIATRVSTPSPTALRLTPNILPYLSSYLYSLLYFTYKTSLTIPLI